MANTNTDLTEEDAADLQFPKETATYFPALANNNDNCVNCFSELSTRFILCEQCNVQICCDCFAKGKEFFNHKNDHDYRVLTTNFVLFENTDWTAQEEITLLDSLMKYSNWNLVGQELPKRSVSEIIEHYDYFYLDQRGSSLLPRLPENEAAVFPEKVVPYRVSFNDIEEPPRYTNNKTGYQNLAGYNAARGDFENEYDAHAEDILSRLEIPDQNDPLYDFLVKIQCSIIESYNRRLRERIRWKTVIRNHGLLLMHKTLSWLKRYDMTITKPVYEKMLRFMQVCEPMSFELLMEGLHRAGEVRIQIARLCELRKKGISTLAEGNLYLKLNKIHEENKKQLKIFRANSQHNWKSNKTPSAIFSQKLVKRRSGSTPIEILGMPGYEKLSEKEKNLCRTVRLVPLTYLELKEVLLNENTKMGSVRLQTARKLLKIDVNKTRKLFDFLVEEGFINKASP